MRTRGARGGLRLFRTLRVRGDSHNPTSASRTRRSALAPFRLSILFLSRGGILFEIEWAETGLGRASCKETGSGRNEMQNPTWCLRSFQLGMRHAYGVHPRHPPRTFPLGLLAPRCLGKIGR